MRFIPLNILEAYVLFCYIVCLCMVVYDYVQGDPNTGGVCEYTHGFVLSTLMNDLFLRYVVGRL